MVNNMKLRKEVIYILILILIISIGTVYFKSHKKKKIDKPKVEIKEKDELLSLYNKKDTKYIRKYVSDKNIKYIIKNKLNVIEYIRDDYYIDDYLKDYLKYSKENEDYSTREIIERVNTHVNKDYYTNIMDADTKAGKYILLNKYYKAPSTYAGDHLIDVNKEYNLYDKEFQLSSECYQAFLNMYNDAKNEGYAFKINSPYRSYESQEIIYNRYVASDGQDLADTYSARPGHSEHQTGYAFDVRDYPLTNEDYSKTKSFKWVSENSYKYGFILRFPKGKEDITGYQYESWHYRYCGIECATYIHKTGITFEEYYEYFYKYKNPKDLQ